MTRRTRIVIQTDSLLYLRGRNATRARCPICEAESEMVTLESLHVVSNLDRTELDQWINSRDLHRVQGADGSTLICLNSLLARVQNTQLDDSNPNRSSK